MIPEAKFIRNEIKIRDMYLPDEVMLTKRSLLRWLALSLGLINENESRTGFLDVFEAFISLFSKEREVSSRTFLLEIKKINPSIHEKTAYYHIKRLQDLGLLNRKKGMFVVGEGMRDFNEEIKELYKRRFEKAFVAIEVALKKLEGL